VKAELNWKSTNLKENAGKIKVTVVGNGSSPVTQKAWMMP